MSEKPTKDQVLLELMEFFMEELAANEAQTMDWLVQGHYDADDMIKAIRSLREEYRKRV